MTLVSREAAAHRESEPLLLVEDLVKHFPVLGGDGYDRFEIRGMHLQRLNNRCQFNSFWTCPKDDHDAQRLFHGHYYTLSVSLESCDWLVITW